MKPLLFGDPTKFINSRFRESLIFLFGRCSNLMSAFAQLKFGRRCSGTPRIRRKRGRTDDAHCEDFSDYVQRSNAKGGLVQIPLLYWFGPFTSCCRRRNSVAKCCMRAVIPLPPSVSRLSFSLPLCRVSWWMNGRLLQHTELFFPCFFFLSLQVR